MTESTDPFSLHEVADALHELSEDGVIPTDWVVWPADLEGAATARAKLAARGFWRSPGITTTCVECDREFTLHVWTKTMPTKASLGKKLRIRDSEGGVVVFQPWFMIREEGVMYDWLAVCDVCSPL